MKREYNMIVDNDVNASPASDGYKLTKKAGNFYIGAVIASALILGFVPREYELLRMLAFGLSMLLAGVVIGHEAHIWTRPKLARIVSRKD